jgi:hypothetical protein
MDRIDERSSYRKIKQCRNCRGTLRVHVTNVAATCSDAAEDLPQHSGLIPQRSWAQPGFRSEPSPNVPRRPPEHRRRAPRLRRSRSRSSADSTVVGMFPAPRHRTNGAQFGTGARAEARNGLTRDFARVTGFPGYLPRRLGRRIGRLFVGAGRRLRTGLPVVGIGMGGASGHR